MSCYLILPVSKTITLFFYAQESRLSETPTEDDEEFIEWCNLEAKQVYDTLIQIGGRPTSPIRCNLYWKIVLFGREQFYQETEED